MKYTNQACIDSILRWHVARSQQITICVQNNPGSKDMSCTQTVKKPHGLVMKAQIQSGNVSKQNHRSVNWEFSYRESRKFRPDNSKSLEHYFEYKLTKIVSQFPKNPMFRRTRYSGTNLKINLNITYSNLVHCEFD